MGRRERAGNRKTEGGGCVRIKIGCKTFDVEYSDSVISDGALGTIDYNFNKINIFSELPKDASFLVLLHECYHAFCRDAGRPETEEEELDADFFAFKVLQLFQDNPELIKDLK